MVFEYQLRLAKKKEKINKGTPQNTDKIAATTAKLLRPVC
jgi:hypothetical protein